jgi:hypothetical protein
MAARFLTQLLLRGPMITAVKNQKGLASIETIAMLLMVSVLIGYGIGYFGIVHTSILNSISARTYAFETFDNRSDLTFFRSNRERNEVDREHFATLNFRAHGIRTEFFDPGAERTWHATERSISIGRPSEGRINENGHNDLYNQPINGPERGRGVNPVWIKTVYGICIRAQCGGAGS